MIAPASEGGRVPLVSGNGNGRPPRPRIEMLAPAEPREAAAVIAAVEQFLADTAPAPAPEPAQNPWQRAALVEGVSAKAVFGPERMDDGSSEDHRTGRELEGLDRRRRPPGPEERQKKIRNIRAVDIVSTGLRGENLDEYRAHVRVAFLVESAEISDGIS